MVGSIFLSASVPDPSRSAEFAATADTVAIRAAISAIVYVVLGRRRLVFGGHPAITPMIWPIAEDLTVDYGDWVKLYQSRYFEDDFPEDNAKYQNVRYTDPVGGSLSDSLKIMRAAMFGENSFDAAVFIGGMSGILDEFEMLKAAQPNVKMFPVASTGGAALKLFQEFHGYSNTLLSDLSYVPLFHQLLEIPVTEIRYQKPELQPQNADKRQWKSSD